MVCESEQALVDRINDEYQLARDQCADGIRGACGKIAGLRGQLAGATNALNNCRADDEDRRGVFRRLNFAMQRQGFPNWCWAATTVSVANFYGDRSRTQCQLATEALNPGHDCCAGDASRWCDSEASIVDALQRMNHWTSQVSGNLTDVDAKREIRAGRPIALRIRWRSNFDGHFIAVVGHRAIDNWVAVADSLWGPSDMPMAVLNTNYRADGNVTSVNFTNK